jgi:hypothetical protein
MNGAAMGVATDHISSIHTCFFEENEAGKQESIMAIAIMYVAVKPGTTLTGGSNAAAGGAAPGGAATPAAPAAKGLPKGFPKGQRATGGASAAAPPS